MEDPRTHGNVRTADSSDLFETPQRETPGDKIKSALSLQTEPTFTVTLEILTVTAAVVIVLLIVVFYMGFLRGKDVERRDIARKISELKSRQAEGMQVRTARSQFAPQTAQRAVFAGGGDPSAPLARPAVRSLQPTAANVQPAAAPRPATTAAPKSVAISPRKPYTVQAVAYRSQSRAQSEVAQLTQKGYAARMVVQGALYVVCVGEYSSRYEAQKDLRALKRIYPDSYLRKF
jgi:septal ring-binding cell division protein DamX